MKRMMNRKGQVLVAFVFALFALCGAGALVTDVGILYVHRVQLQKSLDAAVLAGAQELPTAPASAIEMATQYANANGKALDTVVIDVINGNKTIRANGSRNVNLFLAGIFGQSVAAVNAKARADIGIIIGYTGVVPFGLQEKTLTYGVDYVLKAGGGEGNTGNFGALSLSGSGASAYRTDIEEGYQQPLKVGDIVSTKPGNNSGPTTQGVIYRISQDSNSTFATVQSGSPRIIVIPIVSGDPQGRDNVTVVGFASFFLEGVGGSGVDNYVTGKFMREVLSGEIGVGTDFGAYGAKLVNY